MYCFGSYTHLLFTHPPYLFIFSSLVSMDWTPPHQYGTKALLSFLGEDIDILFGILLIGILLILLEDLGHNRFFHWSFPFFGIFGEHLKDGFIWCTQHLLFSHPPYLEWRIWDNKKYIAQFLLGFNDFIQLCIKRVIMVTNEEWKMVMGRI